jgi:hypothetical protein
MTTISEGLRATEAECAKGRTAPRISLQDIEDNVRQCAFLNGAEFHSAAGLPAPDNAHVLTLCVLTLRNGFTLVAESAPASPENFDEDLGRRLAREQAVRKAWPLMGYELRERLYQAERSGEEEATEPVVQSTAPPTADDRPLEDLPTEQLQELAEGLHDQFAHAAQQLRHIHDLLHDRGIEPALPALLADPIVHMDDETAPNTAEADAAAK